MNKKVKFFLLVIVAVSGLSYFYLNHSNNQILDEESREFKVDDISIANQIAIVKGNKEVVLQKKEGSWLVNETVVTDNKVKALINVLATLEVKNRIAKELKDSLKTELMSNGTLITVYNNEQVLRSYYLGQDLPDSSGIYGIKSKGDTPFVLYQMGEKKLFNPLFSNNELDWKSTIIFSTNDNFNDNPNESISEVHNGNQGLKKIKSITLSYKLQEQRLNSFNIEVGDFLQVKNSEKELLTEVNQQAVVEYLRSFSEIKAEKLVVEKTCDSLPFFVLTIETKSEATTEIPLLEKVELIGFRKKALVGQTDYSGKLLSYDNEYFYLQKGNTWYLVNYFTFDALLKSSQDFKSK